MDEDTHPVLEVQFTQTFKIRPPASVSDSVEADYWFHNDTKRILQDGLDVNQGEVEVLSIEDE